MEAVSQTKKKEVGIVGGGKAGLQLLRLFHGSGLTTVQFVADMNANAPAIIEAQKMNVPTFTDIEQAVKLPLDFIFEVTGRSEVDELLTRLVDTCRTSIVTHDMAFVILKAITESDQRLRDDVVHDITEVKTDINQSLQGILRLVDNINSITSQMQILSINARIEAARVGEHGKGFAVVATEMGKSAEMVKEITTQIQTVNATIASTSDRINTSLNRLKTS